MRPCPLHFQTQSTECGLASMRMILAHFGCHVDLETLRRISGVSRDCVDAKDLLRIAAHFGLDARVVRTEPERLVRLGFPLVVFTDFIHFTVVESIDEREVILADPGFGRFAMPREEFDESFTGVALTFTPSDRFQPGGHRIALRHRILRQLRFSPPGLVLTALTAQALWILPLLPALLHLAGPGGGADATFVRVGLAGLLGAGTALTVAAWASARAEDRYCRNRLAGMARHVLMQSHAFFVYRVHAVMAQRIGVHDTVADTLFRVLIPALAAAVMLPAVLITLAVVHLPAAALALLLVGLHLWLNHAADRAAIRQGRARQDDRDVHWMKLSHKLENFESFKTSGGDREFFNDAMGLCARRLDVRQRTGLYRGAAELSADMAVWLLLPGILVCLLIWPPAEGIAAQSLIAAFCLAAMLLPPLRAVAGLHGTLDTLRFALPPLDDLHDSPVETEAPAAPMAWPAGGAALSLRDVRFGFASVKPPLFDGVTVAVRPGEWIALTGPSGGGKSALAALMIGLHRPWTGAVVLDGRPIHDIRRDDLARRIGWVDKHPFFAPGSIRDNIRLWDETVTEADLAAAVADACLDDVIAGFPTGLDTPLALRAANLSGGQRQRVELARVLARNPGLIVIDEATDGLDPDTERRLFGNLRRRGVTVLIVSHRASTLDACDRALRLSEGRLVAAAAAAGRPVSRQETDVFTGPEGTTTERAAADMADFDGLARAFERVAGASGIPVVAVPLPTGGTVHGALSLLARHNRLMLRPVRFAVADWWRRDTGSLIGFLRRDGRPVAILPDQSGVIRIHDARSGAALPGDPAEAMMPTAYRIYPRFARPSVRVRDFFGTPLRLVGRLLVEGVLADLLLAGLLAGGPAAAFVLMSGAGAASVLWSGALTLWALALTVLGATRLAAQHRLEGILELSAHSALYQHLMRIQPLFVRDHAPQEVNRSLQALPDLLAVLRGGAIRRLAMGAGAAACLAFIAVLMPQSTGSALLLLTPFALVPALLARHRSKPAAALLQRRPANRVFLAALTKNAAKLRQSARTVPALLTWERLVDAERAPAATLRRWEAAAEAFLHWYVFAAAGWFAFEALRSAAAPAHQAASALAFLLAAVAARQAAGAMCEIARIGPALRRLRLLAEAPVDPPAAGPGTGEAAGKGALDLRHVRYRYPGGAQAAVDDVSLRVGPGEIVALTGPSGCGKSTLLRLVLGFHAPDEGEILRDGFPSGTVDISAWREGIGAVLQDDELEQAMTIRGHIGGDDGFTLTEIREVARLAQLEPDLDAMPMGIQTIVDSERISTGQKQRILIARRLVRKPKLLILDEATNALPDAMQSEIFSAIRASGISCLVVSHRASALALADRVYRMAAGRVIVEEPAHPGTRISERTPEWTP